MAEENKARKGETVGAFIARQPRDARRIMERLRELVRSEAPGAEESIKWGHPWYSQEGHLCAFMRHADYVRLQLIRGVELDDPSGLLEGTGKGMRHLKIRSAEDLPEAEVKAWIRQAVELNLG